jgi:hypothetical protein
MSLFETVKPQTATVPWNFRGALMMGPPSPKLPILLGKLMGVPKRSSVGMGVTFFGAPQKFHSCKSFFGVHFLDLPSVSMIIQFLEVLLIYSIF